MDSYTAKSKSGPKSVNLEKKECIVCKHNVQKYMLSVQTMGLVHTAIENPRPRCTGTISDLRPYFNPFYTNFRLKYLMAWSSICCLRSVGSELLRWQRFKMLMVLIFKIFHHVCLNVCRQMYTFNVHIRKSKLCLFQIFLMFIMKAGTLFHI